jgi:hypothetical protein
MKQSEPAGQADRKPSQHLRDEFRLKEYEALLDKIAHTRADVGRAETIYPLAIATIYAWVFTNPPAIPVLWTAAMVLPVAIATLGIVRLYSRKQGMNLLEDYVREMEVEIYGADSALGWERRYTQRQPLKVLILVRAGLALAILAGTGWMAWHADAYFRELQMSRVQHG